MQTLDFSPLFRSTVGFDRLMRLADAALSNNDTDTGYPPYNIERTGETSYRITMAVAGFSQDDVDITVKESSLVIAAKKAGSDTEKGQFLYRGIASRAFERRFQLAEFMEVQGATLENGLLHVALERVVPEEKKPRTIPVTVTSARATAELEQAA